MYIYFFPFEVRVASGDCRIAIFAGIRIDNLPVHLGYNGTSNSSRVNLKLLKSYKDVNGHEELVNFCFITVARLCNFIMHEHKLHKFAYFIPLNHGKFSVFKRDSV